MPFATNEAFPDILPELLGLHRFHFSMSMGITVLASCNEVRALVRALVAAGLEVFGSAAKPPCLALRKIKSLCERCDIREPHRLVAVTTPPGLLSHFSITMLCETH